MKMNYKRVKLETYLPAAHLKEVKDALRKAGAGKVGNYDRCMSYSRVIGTWRALEGANPYIGKQGVISEEEEIKIEVVLQKEQAKEVVGALRAVHPYEEPVINLFPLLEV